MACEYFSSENHDRKRTYVLCIMYPALVDIVYGLIEDSF